MSSIFSPTSFSREMSLLGFFCTKCQFGTWRQLFSKLGISQLCSESTVFNWLIELNGTSHNLIQLYEKLYADPVTGFIRHFPPCSLNFQRSPCYQIRAVRGQRGTILYTTFNRYLWCLYLYSQSALNQHLRLMSLYYIFVTPTVILSFQTRE